MSSGGGSTPPNAAVGARWCSMHVRFVTTIIICARVSARKYMRRFFKCVSENIIKRKLKI